MKKKPDPFRDKRKTAQKKQPLRKDGLPGSGKAELIPMEARNCRNDPETGRFNPTGGLNEQQELFIREMILNGGNASQSAISAGYASRIDGYRLMKLPQVARALHTARVRRLSEAACQALGTMVALLESPSQIVQYQASRWILETAGHIAPKALAAPSNEKTLSEMTEEELAEIVRKSREEVRVLEAEIVDNQPLANQNVPQT